jgi:hypothetical protein
MDNKCDAESWRLNCSCCDEVRLTCNLTKGHLGYHSYVENQYLDDKPPIIILWSYVVRKP